MEMLSWVGHGASEARSATWLPQKDKMLFPKLKLQVEGLQRAALIRRDCNDTVVGVKH